MGLFNRSKTKDVVYLTPIQMGNEQLPGDKVRMLYCDVKGNIGSVLIENSVYELARSYAEELEQVRKNYAILGLEISRGKPVPLPVTIGPEQAWALNHILGHALNRRIIPDVLKKYPKEIIRLGEAKRRELESQHEQAMYHAGPETTSGALQRLSYYPEDAMEVAVPIYKAGYRYPLVVLKRLLSNEPTHPNMQRLLILDSDGDLGIIRVPLEVISEAERNFAEWENAHNSDGCILYLRYEDGFMMSQMEISKLQRRALDIIARHFEETGRGERPIPVDVQAVLERARVLSVDQ